MRSCKSLKIIYTFPVERNDYLRRIFNSELPELMEDVECGLPTGIWILNPMSPRQALVVNKLVVELARGVDFESSIYDVDNSCFVDSISDVLENN